MAPSRAGLVGAAIVLSLARSGLAQEGADVEAPGPPSLPPLAHDGDTYTFEYTFARIAPNAVGRTSGDAAYAWFAHGALEVPLVPRAWYVGVAHDVAAAALPGAGQTVLAGNPELWGRGLWSSVRGLASGGGFGVVVPVPRDLSAEEQAVLRTVRVVRPWDVAYFDDRAWTFRPWLDIRHLAGPVVLQLRQGMDGSLLDGTFDLTARLTFFAALRPLRELGLGVEVWEIYAITSDRVSDDKRATFAISPSIRLDLGAVGTAVALLFPIETPLRGDVADFQAARIVTDFRFDLPFPRPSSP